MKDKGNSGIKNFVAILVLLGAVIWFLPDLADRLNSGVAKFSDTHAEQIQPKIEVNVMVQPSSSEQSPPSKPSWVSEHPTPYGLPCDPTMSTCIDITPTPSPPETPSPFGLDCNPEVMSCQ